MANPYFQFKQFTVWHDKCAMKVGTDAVLLGAWTDITGSKSILDVGTGTGIIALMLAQRGTGLIDAIDIDADACAQAKENVLASPFAERINVVHAAYSEYSISASGIKVYDLIVSNPPYFVNSLKCPDSKRATARHTDSLPLSELISSSRPLLSPHGRIALILPYEQLEEVKSLAQKNMLSVSRQTDVVPVRGAQPKRLLIELSCVETKEITHDTLVLEEPGRQHTAEYVALTKDFYLKM